MTRRFRPRYHRRIMLPHKRNSRLLAHRGERLRGAFPVSGLHPFPPSRRLRRWHGADEPGFRVGRQRAGRCRWPAPDLGKADLSALPESAASAPGDDGGPACGSFGSGNVATEPECRDASGRWGMHCRCMGWCEDELLLAFPMYPMHAPDLRTAPVHPPSVSAVPGIVSSNPFAVSEDLEIPVH